MNRYPSHYSFKDGLVIQPGTDMPASQIWSLEPIERDHTEHVLVIKVPGHRYWSGRSQQSYAPVRFTVLQGKFTAACQEGKCKTVLSQAGLGFTGHTVAQFGVTLPDPIPGQY